MKATDLLKEQHKEVKDLFENVLDTEDAEERQTWMDEIVQKLQAHTQIEEEIFYPAIREEGEKGEKMILEALEEHHVVDLVMAELPSLDPEDERFEAKMTVLCELVNHHVEEEEKEMFKLARKLDKDELERLGERLEARFNELSGDEEEEEGGEEGRPSEHR
jgi:hemerythrin superfamily protein